MGAAREPSSLVKNAKRSNKERQPRCPKYDAEDYTKD
jgi:hypothetical protein